MIRESAAARASAALVRELARVQGIHVQRAGNPIIAGGLDRLADWQARRLRMTYSDLAANPRYKRAISFFLSDLYGGGDFARRDADLARIVPLITRMLPVRIIEVVTQAVELNALSQELDLVMVNSLPRADGALTVPDYCRAYRRAGNFPARLRQIALTHALGSALDRYVGKSWVRASLAVMRQPARAAGLQSLQDLLERGFAAFRLMRGADEFLGIIAQRETSTHDAIVAGSSDPFPDPMLGLVLPPQQP